MILLKIVAISGGLIVLFSGVWAGFEAKKPFNIVGALLAPVGLIISLLGVLLLCVPDFFK